MAELLALRGVCKSFPVTGGMLGRLVARLEVVNGVDLEVRQGETLGLVGESGCGKSTLARLVMRLLEPSAGEILLGGRPVAGFGREYYEQVQMVFQDPFSSLNPRLRVGRIVGEMARIRGASWTQALARARRRLAEVGLEAAALDAYPHQFSGGQRQRIAIARALMAEPRLLIADEPVSSLDLETQAQILALLAAMRQEYELTLVFISHDLNTVRGFCHRVAVMYLGRVVEVLPAPDLLATSCHPYTRALIASIPTADPRRRSTDRHLVRGEVPGPHAVPPGCPYHPRCDLRVKTCTVQRPTLKQRDHAEHLVACPMV